MQFFGDHASVKLDWFVGKRLWNWLRVQITKLAVSIEIINQIDVITVDFLKVVCQYLEYKKQSKVKNAMDRCLRNCALFVG